VDPTRRLSQREISVAKDIEDMSEEDVREALLAVDREEVRVGAKKGLELAGVAAMASTRQFRDAVVRRRSRA
jgi:hypothetical protein